MTTTDWMVVGGALVGGLIIGIVASRVVNAFIGSEKRPPAIRNAAGPMAKLVLWAGIVTDMAIALGVVSPGALDKLPQDLIDYIPRIISAAIVIIVANVATSFATAAVAPALGRMAPNVQRQILSVIRITIVSLAVLLAVRQLGFDTTVINLAVAAIFFGVSGALMLLVALGGRDVAVEVASTRVLRRILNQGDPVRLSDMAGTVAAVHPTTIEIVADTGETLMVPSSRFVNGSFSLLRAEPPTERRQGQQ